jgi:uncharacterized protein YjiS (DUF1127 family)
MPDKPSFVKFALKAQLTACSSLLGEAAMAHIAHPFLTNSQVSLHWPAARRRRREGAFARARSLLRLWWRRIQERNELAQLDERDLRDIGQSGADADREAAKWFWQE